MRKREGGAGGMRLLLLLGLVLPPLLAGCLPSSGPRAQAVVREAAGTEAPFAIVALDPALAEAVSARPAASFEASFGAGGIGGGAPDLTIGTGDLVVVTIYEAASGGLFSGEAGQIGTASKSVSLPPQPVSRAGTISVPYVGQVQAAGRRPAEVQEAIRTALADKAIEPQVLVTLEGSAASFVTVAGAVGNPGRIPLNLGGDRLLDVLAAAGGASAPAYDSFVTLTRGPASATVSLARIVADPGENVYLRPGDQLYVAADPQVYTAFGATARNASFRFEAERVSLAEAVGRAGGLLDSRADPAGVFVFRYEEPHLYAGLAGAGLAGAATAPTAAGVPVVYRLDLKDPASYFAAQRFAMRDNDVIYVSSSPASDLSKFLGVLTGGLGTATRAATLPSVVGY